jgi:hypothetical protein
MFCCRKISLVLAVLAAFVPMLGSSPASADLLFGLDLPTTNINGAPLSSYPDRSNLTPSYPVYSTKPATYLIEGDSFLIGSLGEKYVIEKASLYVAYGLRNTTGAALTQYDQTPISLALFPQLGLWGGPAGNIQHLAATDLPSYFPYSLTRVWYNDGVNPLQNWQRGDGTWSGVWRIDFTPAPGLTLMIKGGEKYYCFLDGLFQNGAGNWQAPSVLGAKPATGGITPVGTLQDPMLFFNTGTQAISNAFTPVVEVYANGAIYGHLTPLPGTLLLLGAGLLGLLAGRKFKKS